MVNLLFTFCSPFVHILPADTLKASFVWSATIPGSGKALHSHNFCQCYYSNNAYSWHFVGRKAQSYP